MADILTQLQTCLDQLATQFYATLGYLTTYHDNSPATPPAHEPTSAPLLAKIPRNSTAPPAPASAPAAAVTANATSQGSPPPQPPQQPSAGPDGNTAAPPDPTLPPEPDSPRTFAARQRELARDLVIKEQQIEYLISVLPGIDSSEAEQEGRIRELEGELRGVEREREERVKELRVLRGRLEGVLGALQVGIYGGGSSSS
ncbi:mediator complex, subunit Med21 [Aspergillus taichungensis]|uniref:Mediator of RNA polymerase II transcription subunit 21 n=1 Tax=Aspergillus taichungensis TaxID=482145 RepID=A0A2J5I1K3_9EURO|nr:mediator complex, subunit Med21 [Aspergillus taichungensis]